MSSSLPPLDKLHDPGSAFGQEENNNDDNEGDDSRERDGDKGTMMTTTTTTALAEGGARPKDNETVTLSPPGPLLADIICKKRDAAWKLSTCGDVASDDNDDDSVNDDGRF